MLRKILMTADTIGGVWTYALELSRALRPHGIEVALATMGKGLSPQQHAAARAVGNISVFESGFRLEWMDDPWEDTVQAGSWLLKLRDRLQPDLVHLNGYARGALSWG